METDNERSGLITRRLTSAPLLTAAMVITVGIPALRAVGLIEWSWGAALAPLTTAGAVFTTLMAGVLVKPRIDAIRALLVKTDRATALTPAPEHLAAPELTDERILIRYPELLAALCHGFRKLKLQATVLGRPVTDPWGVYDAALLAGPVEFEQVKMLARRHTNRFAESGRSPKGRVPPDAHVMKQAVQAFRKCAARTVSGHGDPDCPFEHVTAVFGTRSPNRDAHLKDIAPIVRSLLERQYPSLATAQLADGAHVKYSDWQKQAAQDRQDVAQLRKEQERLQRKLEEATIALEAAQSDAVTVRAALLTARQEARAAGRAEQDKALENARAAIERGAFEHGRELQRVESERDRLLATIEAIASERDALEHALFSDVDADEPGPPDADLAGMRVLLVGGNAGHVPPIREYMEARSIQLLHEDGAGAAELVAGVHLVVLWTRFMKHSTYFAVKRECRTRDVPCCYWVRTSPPSLFATVAACVQASRADPQARSPGLSHVSPAFNAVRTRSP